LSRAPTVSTNLTAPYEIPSTHVSIHILTECFAEITMSGVENVERLDGE
jgi:hypothetical protein